MNMSNSLFIISVLAYLISFVLLFVGYFSFKKKSSIYDEILEKMREKEFHLDLITNTSRFFNASFQPLKIAYIARLYRGVELYHDKNVKVSKATYDYIQSLPKSKITWLVYLHYMNLIAAFLMLIGSVGIIFSGCFEGRT